MQFRGSAREIEPGVVETVLSAPSCAHFTTIDGDGLAARFFPAPGEDARLESRVCFGEPPRFDERGCISFGHGNALRFRTIGTGEIGPSPDPHLAHGTATWEIVGGEGQFHGARGRISSNFFLSDTGEVTQNQLGVIFLNGGARRPGLCSDARSWHV